MKGNALKAFITDGDTSMRNAIRHVFPETHHRLCAWHLLRNAISNICDTRFTKLFRHCMLADMEVEKFKATLVLQTEFVELGKDGRTKYTWEMFWRFVKLLKVQDMDIENEEFNEEYVADSHESGSFDDDDDDEFIHEIPVGGSVRYLLPVPHLIPELLVVPNQYHTLDLDAMH
ncbi:hypothetical protein AHAS_Ahas17G0211200 [Arachis hypogaea]